LTKSGTQPADARSEVASSGKPRHTVFDPEQREVERQGDRSDAVIRDDADHQDLDDLERCRVLAHLHRVIAPHESTIDLAASTPVNRAPLAR
jgi:hypothetical protein